jgi:broad specificity phosphatase PhoE
MATELILVRHGYAIRVNGDYVSAPLTPLGEKQAALTGQLFCSGDTVRPEWLYTSPLRRTKETAAIIGTRMGKIPTVRNGIQELEGLEVPQLILFEFLAHIGFFGKYLYDNSGKPLTWPIIGRVSTVITDLVAKHPNEHIAVVTHAGVVNSVLAWFFPGKRRKFWTRTVDNCSLTRLLIEGTKAEILAVNNTDHLAMELTTSQPAAASVEVAKKVEQTVAQTLPVATTAPAPPPPTPS